MSTGPGPETDDERPPDRQRLTRLILASLAGIVAAGIVIGLLVSWVSATLIGATGMDDVEPDPEPTGIQTTEDPSEPPSDPPSESPSEPPSESPESVTESPSESVTTEPTTEPTTTEPTTTRTTPPEPSTTRTRAPEPEPQAGTLTASTPSAGAYEQVSLTGTFPDVAPGTTLQVERLEGGSWVEFPTTATTDESGSFATYVELGQPGENLMRVTLPGSTRTTATVSIDIG